QTKNDSRPRRSRYRSRLRAFDVIQGLLKRKLDVDVKKAVSKLGLWVRIALSRLGGTKYNWERARDNALSKDGFLIQGYAHPTFYTYYLTNRYEFIQKMDDLYVSEPMKK